MKKLLLTILIMFSCFIVGCDASVKDPCADGHDWEDATLTEPKTCKVCGETKGKPLSANQTIATLQKAFDEIAELNFTVDIVGTTYTSTAGEDAIGIEATAKGIYAKDKILITSVNSGMTSQIYYEFVGDTVTMWNGNGTKWNNIGEVSTEAFDIDFSQNPLSNVTTDMFKFKNGVWVGDCDKLEELYKTQIENQYMTSTITIDKYNVTLDSNGHIKTLDIIMSINLIYGEQSISMKEVSVYTYSKIGKTTLERPEGIE